MSPRLYIINIDIDAIPIPTLRQMDFRYSAELFFATEEIPQSYTNTLHISKAGTVGTHSFRLDETTTDNIVKETVTKLRRRQQMTSDS